MVEMEEIEEATEAKRGAEAQLLDLMDEVVIIVEDTAILTMIMDLKVVEKEIILSKVTLILIMRLQRKDQAAIELQTIQRDFEVKVILMKIKTHPKLMVKHQCNLPRVVAGGKFDHQSECQC